MAGKAWLYASTVFVALVTSCTEREPPSAASRGARVARPEPVERREPAVAEPVDAAAPRPVKRLFTKHWASHVYAMPDRHSRKLGYLRAGSVLRATTHEPVPGKGCRRGWYALQTGGYVCDGIHVHAFDGPRLPDRRPRQPDLDASLPYRYAYVRRDHVPMYRRLPSAREADTVRRLLRAAKQNVDRDAGSGEVAGFHSGDDDAVQVTLPSVLSGRAEAGTSKPLTLQSLQGDEDSLVRQWLLRGFYYSLDEEREVDGRHYWRTQRNGFVPARDLHLVEGSAFQGVVLESGSKRTSSPPTQPSGGALERAEPHAFARDAGRGDAGITSRGWTLPIGFVLSKRAPKYRRSERGRLRRDGFPGYHHAFRIVDEQRFLGRDYLRSAEGWWIRARFVARVEAARLPAELPAESQWIDVDLADQSLVAYEGDTPVYATLISSGKVGRSADPRRDYATPNGLFRISSKHLTHIMDGDHAIDGPYTIEDVPYVMYFKMAYALHSAFWHDHFGRPKSHGCINMAPADARWLFNWAAPALPKGWHALFIPDAEPTTWVRIRGETPKG